MTKLFYAACICISGLASAQISVAGKANLLFPSSSASWKDIKNAANTAIDEKGKNNTGFNVGLSVKIDTPTAFFVMPELYYTTFKNETDVNGVTIEAKSNRVDLPVLLGYNLLGKTLGVYVGPVASYNLSKENTYNEFKENVKNNFTVGYQFGAQAQIKKLLINARYEGAFSKDQREYISQLADKDETIRYDNRQGLFIVGLGYQF